MLRTMQCVIARPWRLDDRLGIVGKDCRNCLWNLESSRGWPVTGALWHRNYRRMSALWVISTFQALLSCSRVHCLIQSHCYGADLVSLYCIWRWPPPRQRLFHLVTLAEVSMAAQWATTDFHTQGNQASRQSVLSLVSDLALP